MKKIKIIIICLLILAPLTFGVIWLKKESNVKITYELDGGVNSPKNLTSYAKEGGAFVLEDAQKEGYDFLGWYTSSDFSEDSKITELNTNEMDEITLYAKFERVFVLTGSGHILKLTEYGKGKEELIVPSSTIEIEEDAFSGVCATKIDASGCENLKTIKTRAFENSLKVTSILLPKNVELIDGRAFSHNQLSSISFPNGSINYELKEGNLVNNTTKTLAIGGSEGIVPEGIKTIGSYAFSMNKEIKRVNIPESVEEIGSHAFSNCFSIQEIKIASNSKLKTIGSYAFSNCREVTEIILPNEVENMGNGAFSNCKKLKNFLFPRDIKVKVLGSSLLYGCESLEEIIIPNGIEEIEYDAFSNCYALKIIEIPETVRKIDGDAFRNSNNLELALFEGDSEWNIKPLVGQVVKIDQALISSAQKFANMLKSNYLPERYLSNPYYRFTWVKCTLYKIK